MEQGMVGWIEGRKRAQPRPHFVFILGRLHRPAGLLFRAAWAFILFRAMCSEKVKGLTLYGPHPNTNTLARCAKRPKTLDVITASVAL